ncbi:NYN domain-containing protein [Candidatus Woesearchaeota archaeon]|nr:NYN domain-containing protein [Candidatus Woesearchaeota archaeon]
MNQEAIIFIDGNNLYHNLKQMKIKPSNLDFKKLANFIDKHFNCNLNEVRYYNSMPALRDGKELYFSHLKFIDTLRKIPKFTVHTRKLQVHSTKEILKEKQDIIDSMELCKNCKPVVKQNILDVIGNVKKKEKGIDIMLAVDLVESAIKNKADILIVLSGDADFTPAMKLAQSNKKEVFSVSLAKGYSRELRENFKFLVLGKNIIMENCLK